MIILSEMKELELEFSKENLGCWAAWFQGRLSHQKFQHKVVENYDFSFEECEALYQLLIRFREDREID